MYNVCIVPDIIRFDIFAVTRRRKGRYGIALYRGRFSRNPSSRDDQVRRRLQRAVQQPRPPRAPQGPRRRDQQLRPRGERREGPGGLPRHQGQAEVDDVQARAARPRLRHRTRFPGQLQSQVTPCSRLHLAAGVPLPPRRRRRVVDVDVETHVRPRRRPPFCCFPCAALFSTLPFRSGRRVGSRERTGAANRHRRSRRRRGERRRAAATPCAELHRSRLFTVCFRDRAPTASSSRLRIRVGLRYPIAILPGDRGMTRYAKVGRYCLAVSCR